MKVLLACEESQAVCKEFRALGHALVCIPKNAKKQSDLYFF